MLNVILGIFSTSLAVLSVIPPPPVDIVAKTGPFIYATSFSSDGQLLACFVADDHACRPRVRILDVTTWLEVALPASVASRTAAVDAGIAWAPTGHQFIGVFEDGSHHFRAWHIDLDHSYAHSFGLALSNSDQVVPPKRLLQTVWRDAHTVTVYDARANDLIFWNVKDNSNKNVPSADNTVNWYEGFSLLQEGSMWRTSRPRSPTQSRQPITLVQLNQDLRETQKLNCSKLGNGSVVRGMSHSPRRPLLAIWFDTAFTVEESPLELACVNTQDKTITKITSISRDATPCWSSDGSLLAFVDSDGLEIMDATSFRITKAAPLGANLWYPFWHPVNNTLWAIRNGSEVVRYENGKWTKAYDVRGREIPSTGASGPTGK